MLDVHHRSAMGRFATWTIKTKSVRLPAIAFINTERLNVPENAHLILTKEAGQFTQISMLDRGSVFLPSPERGDVTIGADTPYPLSMQVLGTQPIAQTLEAVVVPPKKEVSLEGASIVAMGNAIQYIRHPKKFVDEVTRLRAWCGYDYLIYVPGLSLPSNLAFICYCGADIVDTTRIIWESRSNHLLTHEGRWPAAPEMTFEDILCENYRTFSEELEKTIHHIQEGTLREFVEKRAVHDPWNVVALRHIDQKHFNHQELHFPIVGPDFNANTYESLSRPDIIRFRKRINERYEKPESAKILLLLPCSAKKPYSFSRTHTLYRKAVKNSGAQHLVHEIIITSPLGIVPRELELFYPAQNYNIPVTGHWTHDEIAMIQEGLEEYLKRNKYDHTIVHLGSETGFVCDVLEDYTITVNERPTTSNSLSKLTEELRELSKSYPRVPESRRIVDDMVSRCIFQFGKKGSRLAESTEIKGRYPGLKIFSGKAQLGMLAHKRGMISLTLDGAERISREGIYCVQIDDFYPEGNVFAVGVDNAYPEIRIGDEVVVRHHEEVRGVGVACMNSKEMIECRRGEAVRIRHARKV